MYEQYLEVARNAARAAGQIQLDGLTRRLHIETKRSPIDLVTEVDKACEAEIARQLRVSFPTHQLLAEEGTRGGDDPDFRWIVDPLDGTTNYTHHYPFFSTSIALEYQGRLVVGVVFDPVRNELFEAIAGGGAFLNGQPISVSPTSNLLQSLTCTGFPGDQAGNHEVVLAWERISLHCQGVRRDGSAALDLCYVACGRLDGFWERLNAWDMAAGYVLVTEAGGRISNFQGDAFDLYKREIVATNAHIGPDLVAVLTETLHS